MSQMKLPLAQLQRHQLKNLKNLEFPKKHLGILEFLQTRIPTKNSRIPYKKFRIHKKILEFQQKILKNSKIP